MVDGLNLARIYMIACDEELPERWNGWQNTALSAPTGEPFDIRVIPDKHLEPYAMRWHDSRDYSINTNDAATLISVFLSYHQNTYYAILPVHTREEKVMFRDNVTLFLNVDHFNATKWLVFKENIIVTRPEV